MIRGSGILLLLSMFFAYLLAPAVVMISTRLRLRRRGRPVSRSVAILLLYVILFVPGAFAWHFSRDRIAKWVHVTAPESVAVHFNSRIPSQSSSGNSRRLGATPTTPSPHFDRCRSLYHCSNGRIPPLSLHTSVADRVVRKQF